jgi:hypothetical protein
LLSKAPFTMSSFPLKTLVPEPWTNRLSVMGLQLTR